MIHLYMGREWMSQTRYVKVVHRKTKEVLIDSARWCESRFCRLRGLQFSKALRAGEGLLLVMSKDSVVETSIHMFFVFFPIAAVWINSQGKITHTQLAKPWHPYYASPTPARYVLETSLDFLNKVTIGDEVDFV
jgi:uncharacterized membrane protein (UPF0127 family)